MCGTLSRTFMRLSNPPSMFSLKSHAEDLLRRVFVRYLPTQRQLLPPNPLMQTTLISDSMGMTYLLVQLEQ